MIASFIAGIIYLIILYFTTLYFTGQGNKIVISLVKEQSLIIIAIGLTLPLFNVVYKQTFAYEYPKTNSVIGTVSTTYR